MRRKLMTLAGVAGAFAVGIGIAWAVLSVKAETAPDTATARAIGNIDIGNSKTVGLFSTSLDDLDPGDTVSECTNALLENPEDGDTPVVWFGGAGGGLADDLQVAVGVRIQDVSAAGNGQDCSSVLSNYTEVYSGTLAGLLSAHGSYAAGIPWRAGTDNIQVRLTLTLPAGVDPNDVAGQGATFSGTFENRGS